MDLITFENLENNKITKYNSTQQQQQQQCVVSYIQNDNKSKNLMLRKQKIILHFLSFRCRYTS